MATATGVSSSPFSHYFQIDEDHSSSTSTTSERPGLDIWITVIFSTMVAITFLILPMIRVFFLPLSDTTVTAHYAMCGVFFAGELLSLVCITAVPWAKNQKILAAFYGLGRLTSFITLITLHLFLKTPYSELSCIWFSFSWVSQAVHIVLISLHISTGF
jgi:hypothetical protein